MNWLVCRAVVIPDRTSVWHNNLDGSTLSAGASQDGEAAVALRIRPFNILAQTQWREIVHRLLELSSTNPKPFNAAFRRLTLRPRQPPRNVRTTFA